MLQGSKALILQGSKGPGDVTAPLHVPRGGGPRNPPAVAKPIAAQGKPLAVTMFDRNHEVDGALGEVKVEVDV